MITLVVQKAQRHRIISTNRRFRGDSFLAGNQNNIRAVLYRSYGIVKSNSPIADIYPLAVAQEKSLNFICSTYAMSI